MPGEHVERRHTINAVSKREDLVQAIDSANIEDIDREILKMHYIQGKTWGYIADIKGYSIRQIVRRHKMALVKIVAILAVEAQKK